MGFPGVSVSKESTCNIGHCLQYSRLGSILGWKIPWERKWQPYSVFLPAKSCGQQQSMGKSPDVTD